MTNQVNQRGAHAGGNLIGRDDNSTNVYITAASKGMMERLLDRLRQQVDDNVITREVVDELARYHRKKSVDGIDGLENKLRAANKSHCYIDAIEKKEMFVKLLERWSLYESAQQIFVHILAKAELEFNDVIYLQIPDKNESEINTLVIDRIVSPIVEECSNEFMSMNHNIVQGMIYWLAEQCFVRWHHKS